MPKEKLNILLIDDDRDECSVFKEALQKTKVHFELTCCLDTITDVYYELANKNFHLIFLDINLPGESGIKFLKKLKQHESYKNIPVIMYTVSVNEKDIEECFKICAHHYLVKPYSQANMVESLNKIFKADFTQPQAKPELNDFVINLAFA